MALLSPELLRLVRADRTKESVMSVLREQFLQYMRLKGFAQKTLDSYERAVVDLTKAYGVSPDALSNTQFNHLLIS